jgi:hypothetical protein
MEAVPHMRPPIPSPPTQGTRVNLRGMRGIAALQTCMALLLAFFLAPFQHVHTGHGSDTVHAHFYHFQGAGRAEEPHGSPALDSDDDHASARSLDTFTLVLTAGLSLFVPPQGRVLLFVPAETFQPVEVVEECGHDPPSAGRSIPRAPPS